MSEGAVAERVERREFKLSDAQLAALLEAGKPTPVMMIGGTMAASPQANANAAWQALADELGFVWDTVQPVSGKSTRFFTAVAKEPVPAAQTNEVSRALAEATRTQQSIMVLADKGREIAKKYAGVVFNVTTTKGMDEAKKARQELREQARYPIQNLQKVGSKLLGAMQRQFNEFAAELIAEVEKAETPIHEQIEAEETRKANEKAERDRAEAARRQGHTDALAAFSQHVIAAVGESSAEIEARIKGVAGVIVDDSWQEFEGQAQQAKDEALRQLNGMLVAVKGDEAERAELEAERQRQAAWRLQREAEEAQAREAQAARERDLAQREAAVREAEEKQQREREEGERAARERADAIEARIQALRDEPHKWAGRHAVEIDRARLKFAGQPITEDLYGERVREAKNVHGGACSEFDALYNRTRHAEIQTRIEGMSAALKIVDGTPHAPEAIGVLIAAFEELTIDDDYAGERLAEAEAERTRVVGELRIRRDAAQERIQDAERQQAIDEMQKLIEDAPKFARTATLEQADAALSAARDAHALPEYWGGRLEEAVTVRAELTATLQKVVYDVSMRVARERITMSAERLYITLRAMVLLYQHEASAENPALLDAKALLLEINPAETFE